MTEITLKDGRTFNSKFARIENAIADISDYLFCEYNETLNVNDIETVTVYNY